MKLRMLAAITTTVAALALPQAGLAALTAAATTGSGSLSISVNIPISTKVIVQDQEVKESKADRIVSIAQGLIGVVKYSHVYRPPYTMDGSGFTYYVFKKAGIDLGTRDDDKQVNVGKKVHRWELQKGDLVFFSSKASGYGNIGQVGIYMGDDRFIQIFEPGKTAVVSRLNGSKWWSEHYVTARRVI